MSRSGNLPAWCNQRVSLISASGSHRRKSFAGRPNAILFWRIWRAGVFQQARPFSTVSVAGGIIVAAQQEKAFASSIRGKCCMPIEKRKKLLVPLNTPLPPTLWARIVIASLRPPLLILGFVFGNLYKLCFGWLDKRMAQQNEQRFAENIRTHLAFLFSEHGAMVVPNEGVPFPPSFDGAYVTVAVGNLLLRFLRGRGDFSVRVASAFAPNDWEDFQLVADGIGQWDTSKSGPRYYTLETFEPILRSRLELLQEALSKDRFETSLSNAVKIHNHSVDEYATTLRQSGL